MRSLIQLPGITLYIVHHNIFKILVSFHDPGCYLLLFILLFVFWRKNKDSVPEGRLVGIFLTSSGLFNFLFGFLKETQASFESTMALNMGQIISIVMVVVGGVCFYFSMRKSETKSSGF
jgi:prolipoprotein diacylglyceryltransferase